MRRRTLLTALLLVPTGLLVAAGPAWALPAVTPASPDPAPTLAPDVEVLRLRGLLQREVTVTVPRTPASDAAWIELARAEITAASFALDRPQLLVVVDRNPRVQQLVLLMAAPPSNLNGGDWKVIGGTKVSTGSMGRFDHYVTPRGIFRMTDAILGFRAEGTLNENGIRGLGSKGMRVWDFGWHVAQKGWKEAPGKPDSTPIRLMMHATDPDKLEQRIGRPASQGCIRIPSAMNRFLDNHGVLDADYERAAITDIRFRTLLPPGRTPSLLAGTAMVVVDSAATSRSTVASATPAPTRTP